jgi:guanylate kinase
MKIKITRAEKSNKKPLFVQSCILLVGPTASGKSTLENKLVYYYPYDFYKTISYTTRSPRVGEIDGVHYNFVDEEFFLKTKMIENIKFNENYYGLPASEFKTNKHIVCVVEPTGCKQIINYLSVHKPKTKIMVVYFDIPEDIRIDNMVRRLDDLDSIKKRLQNDTISLRFKQEVLDDPLLFSKIHNFYTIKKLTNFLHFDILHQISPRF